MPVLPPDDIPFADVARLARPTPAREGGFAVARAGEFLGEPCVLCGDAGTGQLFHARLAWRPPAAAILRFLSIVGVALALALTKRARVTYCLCPHHARRHRFWSRGAWVFGAVTFLSFAGLLYATSTLSFGDPPVITLAVLAAACIGCGGLTALAARIAQPLRAVLIEEDGVITIRGACSAFLSTLPGRT